jgi:hypothetical protein
MTREGPDERAAARSRRRDLAATAAAKAGGVVSLAVVLLGAPAVVHNHPGPGSHSPSQRQVASRTIGEVT